MTRILQWLLFTNSWVAICAASVGFGLFTRLHLPHSLFYSCWLFVLTVLAYQTHRIFRLKNLGETSSVRLNHMKKYQRFHQYWWLLFGFIAMVLGVFIPWNVDAMLLTIGLVIVAVFYVYPIPFLNKSLREIPSFKNTWISVSWAVSWMLPFVLEHKAIPYDLIFLGMVLVYLQIIPFDSRDVAFDPSSMKTLPQCMGKRTAGIVHSIGVLAVALVVVDQISGWWSFVLLLVVHGIGSIPRLRINYPLLAECFWEAVLLVFGLVLAFG